MGSTLLGWSVVLAGQIAHPLEPGATALPVTILKPLYGAEPRLADNLASFMGQDYPAPVQMLCGVQRHDDPAIATVAALQARYPHADIALVVDPTVHGANAKVSNLINLAAHARHDVLVLSDSDIAVAPDYLARVTGALARPGVGAVTCLYRGRGDAGFWSRLVAMGIDLQFLPSTLIGRSLGLAHPCMGSTIALRRTTLDAIGGFARFADVLADDHAIGAAVRALGLTVAIPDMLVVHGCAERSLDELVRHELRWNATVAAIDRGGYAGSVILHPLPLALIGSALLGFSWSGVAAITTAFGVRAAMAWRMRGLARNWSGTLILIPIRDLIAFVLFIASFFVRSVDWRGATLRMAHGGQVTADPENLP